MKLHSLKLASVLIVAFTILSCGQKSAADAPTLDSYYAEKRKCDSLDDEIQSLLYARLEDTTLNDTVTVQMMLLDEEAKLVCYRLDEAMRSYVLGMNGGRPVPDTGDVSGLIKDLSDYDIATWHFVGEKPENPTGAGMQLYDDLARFGEHLHPDVQFFIPKAHTQEDKEQWVKDNFYHASAVDVLVRLQLYRLNVLEAMKTSFDNGLLLEAK